MAPPETDQQFPRWEYAVRKWVDEQGLTEETRENIPKETDPYHTADSSPRLSILNPQEGAQFAPNAKVRAAVSVSSKYPINKVQYFVNNFFVGTATKAPWSLMLALGELDALGVENELKAVAYDIVENRGEASVRFGVGE